MIFQILMVKREMFEILMEDKEATNGDEDDKKWVNIWPTIAGYKLNNATGK